MIMSKVELELATYDALQHNIAAKAARIVGRTELKPQYKGFDDVKAEVEEHFKQGLFDKELEKQKQEQLTSVFKSLQEHEAAIADLKAEVKRLKNRSLWERIVNK